MVQGRNIGSLVTDFAASALSGYGDPYQTAFGTGGRGVPTFQASAAWGSSLPASSWKFLHDNTDATVTFRFQFNWTVNYNYLISTMLGTNATDVGFNLQIGPTYQLALSVGNGSSITNISSANGLFADDGIYTAAGAWTAYLDGVSIASGSVSSPSSANPDCPLHFQNYVGNSLFDSNCKLAAWTCYPAVLSAGDLWLQRRMLEGTWH